MTSWAGDFDGFTEAFRDLYVKAYRVAERLTGSPDDAEELAAEALARTLASWPKVGALPHRDAWVQRVAANLAVDRLRRQRSVPRPPVVLSDPMAGVDLQLTIAPELARLPRRQREVVSLRFVAGLTEVEVAAVLRLSVGTVKSHAARGLATLRGRLRPRDLEVNVVVL